VLAWADGTPTDSVRARVAALRTFGVPTRYLTPDVLRAATVFGRGALEPTPEHAGKVNTLMEPVLLNLYTRRVARGVAIGSTGRAPGGRFRTGHSHAAGFTVS
jgi:hypothetical protein